MNTPKRYQCRHIFTEGRRCGSPTGRGEDLCYNHHTTRRPVEDPRQRKTRTATLDLPMPEDRSAIQYAIGQILSAIAANAIDPRRAGLLLLRPPDRQRQPPAPKPQTNRHSAASRRDHHPPRPGPTRTPSRIRRRRRHPPSQEHHAPTPRRPEQTIPTRRRRGPTDAPPHPPGIHSIRVLIRANPRLPRALRHNRTVPAMETMSLPALIAVAIIVLYIINSIKILKEYERAVVFRLGRIRPPKVPASSSSSARSTRSSASRSARRPWRSPRRTSSPATTSP